MSQTRTQSNPRSNGKGGTHARWFFPALPYTTHMLYGSRAMKRPQPESVFWRFAGTRWLSASAEVKLAAAGARVDRPVLESFSGFVAIG